MSLFSRPYTDKEWRRFNQIADQHHSASDRLPVGDRSWRQWLRLSGYDNTRFLTMPADEREWRAFLLEQEII